MKNKKENYFRNHDPTCNNLAIGIIEDILDSEFEEIIQGFYFLLDDLQSNNCKLQEFLSTKKKKIKVKTLRR